MAASIKHELAGRLGLVYLIVMVIAVEFFFSGLKSIVIDILRSVG